MVLPCSDESTATDVGTWPARAVLSAPRIRLWRSLSDGQPPSFGGAEHRVLSQELGGKTSIASDSSATQAESAESGSVAAFVSSPGNWAYSPSRKNFGNVGCSTRRSVCGVGTSCAPRPPVFRFFDPTGLCASALSGPVLLCFFGKGCAKPPACFSNFSQSSAKRRRIAFSSAFNTPKMASVQAPALLTSASTVGSKTEV
mmetsp:Transcript_53646/g.164977  ORF Transcript_53646/g.164977 Transcript_53646/m.164977 type:complete len:200 (-) Transcript_53646:285-884(-)